MASTKDMKITVVDNAETGTMTFIQRPARGVDVVVINDGLLLVAEDSTYGKHIHFADCELDGLLDDIKLAQQMRRCQTL